MVTLLPQQPDVKAERLEPPRDVMMRDHVRNPKAPLGLDAAQAVQVAVVGGEGVGDLGGCRRDGRGGVGGEQPEGARAAARGMVERGHRRGHAWLGTREGLLAPAAPPRRITSRVTLHGERGHDDEELEDDAVRIRQY